MRVCQGPALAPLLLPLLQKKFIYAHNIVLIKQMILILTKNPEINLKEMENCLRFGG